jgi:hypothetical protein
MFSPSLAHCARDGASIDMNAKKNKRLLILAASFLFLVGCSSTPTKVDNGAIHARTFSFVSGGASPANADKRRVVHSMIQDAITKNLAARGITKVPSRGDVTVAYLVVVGDNASTELVDDYFGYGRDSDLLHEKAQSAYNSSKNPNYFRAGTLLIDVLDSKDFKLIKRGYATRPILQNPSSDARAERIQEVVDEILRDVRVAP